MSIQDRTQIGTAWTIGISLGDSPEDIIPITASDPPGLMNNTRLHLLRIRNDIADGVVPGTERLDRPFMADESFPDSMAELTEIAWKLRAAGAHISIPVKHISLPVFSKNVLPDNNTALYACLITKTANDSSKSYMIGLSPEREMAHQMAAEEARRVWSKIKPESFEICSFALLPCQENKTLMDQLIQSSQFAVPQHAAIIEHQHQYEGRPSASPSPSTLSGR